MPRRRKGFSDLYLALGARLGRRLFDEVRRADSLRPKFTASKVLASILAGGVHGLTLAFAATGVVLIVWSWPAFGFVVLGIVCLAIAWAVRPRLGRAPEDVVGRSELPALHELVDRARDALDAGPVDGIVISPSFGAAFGRSGWRRRRFLYLGLPLVTILAPQERVALVGHELAHDVNGDPTRGTFVGTALGTLETWFILLYPDAIWPPDAGWVGPLMVPVNLSLRLLAHTARWTAIALLHLVWRDSQRAEYLADHLGARVGGTDASVSLLEKLYLVVDFEYAVHAAALSRTEDPSLLTNFRQRVLSGEPLATDAARKKETELGFRLDATHPPTPFRVDFLLSRVAVRPEVVLTQAHNERIDRELMPLQAEIQRRLLDSHRASLYY